MSDCLFCNIISGKIPSKKVYEDDDLFAFRDIDPKAPTHILIIPKEHIPSLNDILPDHAELLGKMVLAARTLAGDEGISDSGYRTVFNCNADAGQAVFHIHLHLLGGRPMNWPPG